ncbi:MAG: 30S ribosomal protein S1 [Bryobacteraceae bacterium]
MSSNQEDLKPGMPAPPDPAHPDEIDWQQSVEGEDLEQMLDEFPSHFAPLSAGEVLTGRIVKISGKDVFVDIGYKSEGLVPRSQLENADGTFDLQPGDEIEVMVDRHAAPVEGYIMLSHDRASRLKNWSTLETAFRDGLLVSGRVTGRVKGGLAVDVGVVAFMPGSQVDARPSHDIDSLVGQDIAVKIVKLNRRRGNVVVSRKAAIEEENTYRKTATLETLAEGSIVTGVVKNITDYGVFVDLGGIDGLLHVSDISYGRVQHPSEALQVGQDVTVKVLKFDRGKERISLGMKQCQPDPWTIATERYSVGSRVVGRVVSITDYGAFVELEAGVEGLIHISEMTWSRRMKHPSKIVKAGDTVECVVLEVKPDAHRVSLGIKQLEADPWTTVAERYSIGSVVRGRVRKLTEFGAFIEVEEGIDGLIHISDMTWSKRVKNPSEVLKKGQMTEAVILNIDAGNRRLSLGIKQLQPDAWESFFHSHNPGDIVKGRVTRAVAFGVFVELAPGVEGLCHGSEVPHDPGRGKDEPVLPVGAELDFKVIKMVESDRKIGLSVKAIADDEERSRLSDYHRQAAAATMTIEEVIHFKTDRRER